LLIYLSHEYYANNPPSNELNGSVSGLGGCDDDDVFENGNIFNLIPERQFFRDNYDDLTIKFDYHVNFKVSEEEENNDFKIKINLLLDDEKLVDMDIVIRMTSEMSGRLTAKYKFDISSHFNYLVSLKRGVVQEDEEVQDDMNEE
jgi:hypothetical protein